MKIRTGFISNSSSSSFIIVGLMYGKEFYKVLEELKLDPENYPENWPDKNNGEPPVGFDFGDYGQYESKDGLVLIDNEDGIRGIGVHANEFLKEDLKVSEISEKLIEILKKRGIKVSASAPKLHVGTSGWG